jgi:hypothetical protein
VGSGGLGLSREHGQRRDEKPVPAP